MITSILIEHYKSIESTNLIFGNVNLLVGSNGCGKSNILDSIRFLKDAIRFGLDRAVSDRHGIDSIRQWSPSRPYNVLISVGLSANEFGHGSYSLTLSSTRGNYRIIREEAIWFDSVKVYRDNEESEDEDEFDDAVRKSQLVRDSEGNALLTVQIDGKPETIKKIEIEHKDELLINSFYSARITFSPYIGGLHHIRRALSDFEAYSIFPNTLRTPQTPSNDARLTPTGDNLTSVYKTMGRSKSGEDAKAEILSAMKLIMPNLEGINIQSLGGLMVPTFRVREETGKVHLFNVSQISDGTLRLLGILSALYHPNRPSVIGLEEPEQAVNPGVLAVIAEAVHEVGNRSQIFLTTHSPNLVDHFNPDEIIAVSMSNGITHAGRISSLQHQAVKDRLMTLAEIMTVEGLSHD